MDTLISILNATSGLLLGAGLIVFVGWLFSHLGEISRSPSPNFDEAENIRRILEAQYREYQRLAEEAERAVYAHLRANADAFQRQIGAALDEADLCAKVLVRYSKTKRKAADVLGDRKTFEATWRAAAMRTHPDANNGGDGQDFRAVMDARERIKTLKGWRS